MISLLALATLAGFAHATSSSVGTLMLAGGAIDANLTSIYGEFITLAGGTSARIGLITAAAALPADDPNSGDPDLCDNSVCNAIYYTGILESTYGAASAEWLEIDTAHISNSANQTIVEMVNSMTGFYFGGGDQSRLIQCFINSDGSDSPVLAAIRAKLLTGGAVVLGSSAGTTIMNGKDIITNGESWEAFVYGPTTNQNPQNANTLTYLPSGGFGFITSGLIDTHFGARGRQGRIVRLAAATDYTRAYGVDENTVLIVSDPTGPNESMRVAGQNGVSILDTSSNTIGTQSGYWSVTGVKYTYLTSGDSYNPITGTASSSKPVYAPSSGEVGDYDEDIFSSPVPKTADPMQMIETITSLFDAGSSTTQYGISYESDPTYEAHFTKDSSTTAWRQGNLTSWENLILDMYVS